MIASRCQCFAVCLSVMVAVGSGSCVKSKGEEGSKDRRGGGRGATEPVVVRVKVAKSEVVARPVSVVAILQGGQQADVFSKVVGRLARRGPGDGDAVTRGQMLFEVDRSDPGESFLKTPVLSPLSGWVGQWHVTDVGEQVSLQEPVVTVVDDRELKATVFLPASDWLSVDQKTQTTVAIDGETRVGQVKTIARAGDAGSGRGSISVVVPNPKRDWRSGLSARITFGLSARERILVTAAALTITDQGAYVYAVEGDKAKRLAVSFSLFDSDTVEITKGLSVGTEIIVAGANTIGDGSLVSIAPDSDRASQ